ncbi:GNAT family N-acetyltransferase [Bartonella tamiae]|uniref:N-acetyltransferase domain-containing protein n=1 Tax=Bartonella tamiae Th239 TaxID=1094558 RepID=J0R4F0_9HYPH|nr:GNAT family protein [Bartonella tamiae]EJF90529.1 hypothetical protein ME5_00930 [Bartonella tamiae Th239]EJF93527.1 hypothetical protein MEG_00951 [Bartonella tamiae Th307]
MQKGNGLFKKSLRRQKPESLPSHFILQANKIYLRPPHIDDYKAWSQLRVESRSFLEPWEPLWPCNAHSYQRYKVYLNNYLDGRKKDQFYIFFIFDKIFGNLIGGISIGNIRRSVIQSGDIGYWCGEKFSGKGFMLESLHCLITFAFQQLKLHRIQAASIPTNLRSMRLLEKAGFSQEGLLKDYVKINGEWRDHILYAMLESEQPAKASESEAL